jgi:hypothetical protein
MEWMSPKLRRITLRGDLRAIKTRVIAGFYRYSYMLSARDTRILVIFELRAPQ